MSIKTQSDPMQRLNVLRGLLEEGKISTQEELVEELRKQKFVVTQSTISRDLTRLSAVKTRDATGRIVYRLPHDVVEVAPLPASNLKGLMVDIQHNGSLIVIRTTPGSASLIASQLDLTKPEGILGTIAGDDTIFVAPKSPRTIQRTIDAILADF